MKKQEKPRKNRKWFGREAAIFMTVLLLAADAGPAFADGTAQTYLNNENAETAGDAAEPEAGVEAEVGAKEAEAVVMDDGAEEAEAAETDEDAEEIETSKTNEDAAEPEESAEVEADTDFGEPEKEEKPEEDGKAEEDKKSEEDEKSEGEEEAGTEMSAGEIRFIYAAEGGIEQELSEADVCFVKEAVDLYVELSGKDVSPEAFAVFLEKEGEEEAEQVCVWEKAAEEGESEAENPEIDEAEPDEKSKEEIRSVRYRTQIPLTQDGTYRLKVRMAPGESEESEEGKDTQETPEKEEAPGMTGKEVCSGWITIDTKAPEIAVRLSCETGSEAVYSNQTQTADITVRDDTFSAEQSTIVLNVYEASGTLRSRTDLSGQFVLAEDGKGVAAHIAFFEDGIYVLEVQSTDGAGNTAAYESGRFGIDRTAPEIVSLEMDEAVSQRDGILFYREAGGVRVTARDGASGIQAIVLRSSDWKNGTKEQTAQGTELVYGADGSAQAWFALPADENGAFSGSIFAAAVDRAGNRSAYIAEERTVIVDSIAPKGELQLPEANGVQDSVSYYKEAVTIVFMIREENFYGEDAAPEILKNGKAQDVSLTWTKKTDGVYEARVQLMEEGSYELRLDYTDPAGNGMNTLKSGTIVVDTGIQKPTIRINGISAEQGTFSNKAELFLRVQDRNLADCEISLFYEDKDGNMLELSESLGEKAVFTGTLMSCRATLPDEIYGKDGIYRVRVRAWDKAGNEETSEVIFTLNRNGSIFFYGEYVSSLMGDAGFWQQKIGEDLVIYEYNPDLLTERKVIIERNGELMEEVQYSVQNIGRAVSGRGWQIYRYVIGKENFTQDGIYRVSVCSADNAGNAADTLLTEAGEIVFWVDGTAPKIDSVRGLEKEEITKEEQQVEYKIFDAGGLARVQVWVDGQEITSVTQFEKDANSYTGTFTLQAAEAAQHIRIAATDLAGNVTDTDSPEAVQLYAFQRDVLVHTETTTVFLQKKEAAETDETPETAESSKPAGNGREEATVPFPAGTAVAAGAVLIGLTVLAAGLLLRRRKHKMQKG